MFFRKKTNEVNPHQSSKLEAKADRLAEKNKPDQALNLYREASLANPENAALYDKMIEIKATLQGEWTEEDFAESLDWTLKQQEIENPELKKIYESLSPEYLEIRQLITQLLITEPELREPLVSRIKKFEAKAVQPLIDTLLSIDELARQEKS